MQIDINQASDLWQKKDHSTVIQAINLVAQHIAIADFELSVLLTNDDEITALNHEFKNSNKPTNVLSFPQIELQPFSYGTLQPEFPLGDIILAHETIERESTEQSKNWLHHLTHLTIHGFLHIVGFDHMTNEDASQMEQLEIELLAQLDIPNPYDE